MALDMEVPMLPSLSKPVQANLQHFTGRTWLLPRVLDWLQCTNERLFLLTGNPGTGKSMVAAWLAGAGPLPKDLEDQARLQQVRQQVKAVHFCQAASGNTAPKAVAQNLAEQLTNSVPEFGDALVDALAGRAKIYNIAQNVEQAQAGAQVIGILTKELKLDLGELGDELSFDRVLREPLIRLYKRGYRAPLLLVVDALDEATTYTGAISITQLLTKLADLPPQVRVLATTRPDPPVLYFFPTVVPVDLIRAAPPDAADVLGYLRLRLGLPHAAEREVLADRLAKAADGNFLYAHLVLEDLLPRLAEVDDLDALPLPADLSELYQSFLTRRIGANRALWRDEVRPVLGLVAVGQGEGLTRGQLDHITRQDTEGVLETWKQYLDGALPNGPFRAFHKSFADFLLDDARNQAYHVDGPRTHERVVNHYWPAGNGAQPWAGWDAYARRYLPTHLAGAAWGRPTAEGHPLAERLVRLMTAAEFQAEYRREVKDLAALHAALEQTLRTASADLDPEALRLISEAAFALIAFRRHELRPEPLFELAGQGEVDSAASRLDLFEADVRWRQAALLVLAWLGAERNPNKARQVLDLLPAALEEPLARLKAHVEAALGGPEVPRVPLREPTPSFHLAQELVRRVEGQGVNVELLVHYGHTAAMQDTEGLTQTGYLAEEDGPVLVAFAAANPWTGEDFFRRYLTTLMGYSYVEYRNQSLWFLLAEALKHPNSIWVKEMAKQMASTALSPAGADFREGMWITAVALLAAAVDSEAREAFDRYASATFGMAQEISPGPDNSRYSDTYGSLKRRLAVFAQCFAILLNQPTDAQRFLDEALRISEYGFAGFQMPACLSLAESYVICVPGVALLSEQALDKARTAAHNVQDPTFCARSTARYNALRDHWWGSLGGDPLAAAERLAEDSSAPEFAAVHVIGEDYGGRREGGLPRPPNARTLHELSDLYHRPLSDFVRLNFEFGWQPDDDLPNGAHVRVPDRGLAPLLAARFAAEVLVRPGLAMAEQVRQVQALVPVAAANPTALDTVLSRLLLVARPSDPPLLKALVALADKARSEGATGTSYPYHPGTPS